MITKYNIPVITEGGVPNPNNLSDEMQKIYALSIKTNRSNVGQIAYNSSTSGISYNTVNYPAVIDIYNKGETGLYNLLIQELNEYMVLAEDLNTNGTGIIPITDWTANIGDYAYKVSVVIDKIINSDIVNICIDKESIDIAASCAICPTNESYNGGIIIYAKKIPTEPIPFTYRY